MLAFRNGKEGVPYLLKLFLLLIIIIISEQIQNLQNCFTTQTKMTSKDDIKGLVSLKFLRPCCRGSLEYCAESDDFLRARSIYLRVMPDVEHRLS
jgi:hypothetical protein